CMRRQLGQLTAQPKGVWLLRHTSQDYYRRLAVARCAGLNACYVRLLALGASPVTPRRSKPTATRTQRRIMSVRVASRSVAYADRWVARTMAVTQGVAHCSAARRRAAFRRFRARPGRDLESQRNR